jgi:hypothetical protein
MKQAFYDNYRIATRACLTARLACLTACLSLWMPSLLFEPS